MMKLKSEYIVQLHGSSLIGDIFGQDSFLDTYLVLKSLRQKSQLKCFKLWCPTCKDPNPENHQDLIWHFFAISFTNVRKLLVGKEVQWRWNNPNGDWAQKNGDPTQAAGRLLASRSRPNWKVIIAVHLYEVEE